MMQYSRYGASILSILSSALPVLGAPASTNENSLTPRNIGADWMMQTFEDGCSDATPLWTRYGGIEGLTGECIDIARVGTYIAEIDLDGVTMQFFRAPCSVASLQNAGPRIWKGNEWNQMCQMGGDVGWQSYVIFNNGDGGW